MHGGERDLGGTGEKEAVLLERVDVRLLGREETRPDHRLLADEHRWQHGCEPRRRDVVERKAVEREREQGGVADDVAEPRSGESGGALELESADLARLLRVRRAGGLAEAADLDGVVLRVTVRGGIVRWIRDERERVLTRSLRGRQLLLGCAQLLLHTLELFQLLGRRLALELGAAAQIVDARHEQAPALVGGEQRVERLCRALAGERRAPYVGVRAGCLEVDHARDSR